MDKSMRICDRDCDLVRTHSPTHVRGHEYTLNMDWTFGGTWPYTPRWFNSADGRVHYMGEGPRTGRPVGNERSGVYAGVPRTPLAARFSPSRSPRLEDAGHYLQEDAHERIVPARVNFLRRT
jgi:hypothetical protein